MSKAGELNFSPLSFIHSLIFFFLLFSLSQCLSLAQMNKLIHLLHLILASSQFHFAYFQYSLPKDLEFGDLAQRTK